MKNNLEQLLTPFTINNCEVKNRCIAGNGVATATLPREKFFSKQTIAAFVNQAQNGVGMIIAGREYVHENSFRTSMRDLVSVKVPPNYSSKLRKMVAKVHDFGAKIFADVGESFNTAIPNLNLERTERMSPIIESHYLAGAERGNTKLVTEQKLIDHYVVSAQTAKLTGYDGIQLNLPALKQGACQFDIPQDEQSVKEIMYQFEIAGKIVQAIKEACGTQFPVTMNVRLSQFVVNYMENQLTEELFFEPILTYDQFFDNFRELEKAGYDGFNIETKEVWSNWEIDKYNRDSFLRLSESIKKWVKIPVIISGLKGTVENAAHTISEGVADAVELDANTKVKKENLRNISSEDDSFLPSGYWVA